MRLFIALDTPPEIRAGMVRVRDDLRSAEADVRWEPEDKLHCTLKFLGETPPDRMGPLTGALDMLTSAYAPFPVRYRGVGVFPPHGIPRVIWIGMDDEEGKLASLAGAVDRAMGGVGFPREERPFRGHVTLGRVRSPRGAEGLHSRMETITFEGPQAIVDRILLKRSILQHSGSVYATLHTSRLAIGNSSRTV